MNDLIEGVKISGEILMDGKDIYKIRASAIDALRRKIGMVFKN